MKYINIKKLNIIIITILVVIILALLSYNYNRDKIYNINTLNSNLEYDKSLYYDGKKIGDIYVSYINKSKKIFSTLLIVGENDRVIFKVNPSGYFGLNDIETYSTSSEFYGYLLDDTATSSLYTSLVDKNYQPVSDEGTIFWDDMAYKFSKDNYEYLGDHKIQKGFTDKDGNVIGDINLISINNEDFVKGRYDVLSVRDNINGFDVATVNKSRIWARNVEVSTFDDYEKYSSFKFIEYTRGQIKLEFIPINKEHKAKIVNLIWNLRDRQLEVKN